jgi:ATP-binding cassette subfamily B multidrug efflux pump
MFRWFERLIDPFTETDRELPRRLLPFYWHFVRQVWPILLAVAAVGLVVAVIEVALFAFLGSLVDLLTGADRARFFEENGTRLMLMGAVVLIARPLFGALRELLVEQALVPSLTNLVRWQTHNHVLGQSFEYFQNDFAGRIANKIMQTGNAVRESILKLIDALWFMGIYIVGALSLFAAADLRLTAPMVLWIASFATVLIIFVPRIEQRSEDMSEARSVLSGRIVDAYTNIATVKLFAHAAREITYGREAMQAWLRTFRSQLRLTSGMVISITCINAAMIFTMAALSIWLWHVEAVTVGDIALSIGLMLRINSMAMWIMWEVTNLFENIGTAADGMNTVSRPHGVVDDAGARELAVRRAEVRFEHIRFHYGKEGGVIDDLSLTIRPGERLGLIGRSGAGKSTLVHLMLRFFDLEGGRILIDGVDIARVTQDSLRRAIGLVSQDTSLLHRSVRDNIRYGRPESSEGEIVAAAKRAQAHEFILELRDLNGRAGYDAHVGERGVKLSGGQRQRVAIARVLLKDAPILILDEATSALDSEVEAAIQDQLYNLMQGKTVIAIAHRLSTIARMERLVVLDKGKIAEQGSHQELLRRGGLYAALWARQSGGFLIPETAA